VRRTFHALALLRGQVPTLTKKLSTNDACMIQQIAMTTDASYPPVPDWGTGGEHKDKVRAAPVARHIKYLIATVSAEMST